MNPPPAPTRARPRRVVCFGWAVLPSLLTGLRFGGVSVITVGWRLAKQNRDSMPVTDLGFIDLGATITAGLAMPLGTPERHIDSLQQAVIRQLALGVAGPIGGRVEPLTGAVILIVTTVLVVLHPVRPDFFTIGRLRHAPLAALALTAPIPATADAATMLVQARWAGSSCFLDVWSPRLICISAASGIRQEWYLVFRQRTQLVQAR